MVHPNPVSGRIGILPHVSQNDAMELHWRTNEGVSLFHAVDQVRRGYALSTANLAAALAEPTATIVASVREERLVPELFWRHLVPLAAEFDNPRQLAEVLLVKLQGRTEARVRIPRFTRNLTALRSAYDQAAPSLEESAPQIEALKQNWAPHGAGLLAGLKTWTDDAILVDEAIVYVVPPVTPGGGWMHLPYNSVRLEPVADVEGQLSEVLRLAWLLAPLNLDMPTYSEAIITSRLDRVAALAMIPVTLAAAEKLRLESSSPERIAQAVRQWLPPAGAEPAVVDTLAQWWETYKSRRPPWSAALTALDQLLPDVP